MSSQLRLYHGYDTVYEDDLNVLTDWESGEKCILPKNIHSRKGQRTSIQK